MDHPYVWVRGFSNTAGLADRCSCVPELNRRVSLTFDAAQGGAPCSS